KPEDIREVKERDVTIEDEYVEQIRYQRDLSTSVNIFALVWLLAIPSGWLLDVSLWMFFPATVVLLYAVDYATMRIIRARKVEVKVFEVALLGALIPLLATGSVLSYFYFPNVTSKFTIALMSMMLPHITLLMRTRREIDHPFLLVLSSCLLIGGLIATGFAYELAFITVIPTAALSVYSLFIQFGAIFMLREEIPVGSLKWDSLGLLVLCVTFSIISYFLAIHLLYGLIAATIASVFIFVYLDFLEYQMQTPLSMWTYESFGINIRRATIKLLSFVVIASWGIMGVMQDKVDANDEVRNATFGVNVTNNEPDKERDVRESRMVITG
ncbi:hypothetical protein PENTCL1PPCAC_19330, partial [Pristionchus entomophagus]